ncbi:hypothetical protein [Kribbella sp. NPDC048928]|uniref:hypothetical protein n=1 Tax=Kribbella sp. NPDC048928 TaxID=3364111 RepID=UPI003713545A
MEIESADRSDETDTREFLEAYRDVMDSMGRGRPLSPMALVDQWRSFVQWCEEGYGQDIYEYENDLSVRETVERVLRSERLQRFDQMVWVREQVAEADERFRRLLSDEKVRSQGPWWKVRLPRIAGAVLAADVRDNYNVDIPLPGEDTATDE